MDMGNGTFKKFDNQEKKEGLLNRLAEAEQKSIEELEKKLFQVGEEVKIKDSIFRIKKITKKGMNLKLLPEQNNQSGQAD